jgi:hypothetical protein
MPKVIKLLVFGVIMSMTAISPSFAEHWQTIGQDDAGTIFEIDTDTVHLTTTNVGKSFVSAMISAGGRVGWLVFDCHGHFLNGGALPWSHIANGSFLQSAELQACYLVQMKGELKP